MTVKFLFSLILGGSGFLLWFWFCKCLKKQFVWEGTWKKESRAFLFWVAFFVRNWPEPSSCQHLIFSIWAQRKEREKNIFIFFNWVALASFCVLKIDFLFMLEHSTSFNNCLVSDSFFSSLFVYDLFCFGFAQNETKNETRFFVSWREEKNGTHLFHWN